MSSRVTAAGLLCALLLRAHAVIAADSPAILPVPERVELSAGSFTVSSRTAIFAADTQSAWIARYLSDFLQRTRGLSLQVTQSAAPHAIALSIDPAMRDDAESYDLSINGDGVSIRANDRRGLFYGAITLCQLLTAEAQPAKSIDLAAMHISDAPRFSWRGIMLDSARHYQSPEFIERFIDQMALLKLNTLHWHLTDDQAWRLEIRQYPRLTEVGAWRVPAGAAPAKDINASTGRPRLYGGFYSQDTVRHLVRYASERGITIVPEIEMPGHATATIVAYPQLGVTATPPKQVPSDWGVYSNLYNADESTFRFLTNVLDEVMSLFPGTFIHVGGDEAVKDQWKNSPQIQARMRELGVADETALQAYFVHRAGEYLRSHGRRLIGWDEILEGKMDPEAAVMSWRGADGARTAALSGHDTVLAAYPTLYFDNRPNDLITDPPGRGLVVPLETVYRFEPMPADIAPEQTKHVLGIQANLWTEHIRTEERVAFMTFPRAAAVAETGWSQIDRRDWNGFLMRVAEQAARAHALGFNYATSEFDVHLNAEETGSKVKVQLVNQSGFGEIRYTLDGNALQAASPVYRDAVEIPVGARLQAATFSGTQRISAVTSKSLDVNSLNTRDSRELKLCTEKVALALEDDAPIKGPRAVFLMDIENPCWIYPAVDLSKGATLTTSVGQVPFNFQIGADAEKIPLRKPTTLAGELEVRLGCEGDRVAVLPLAPAAKNNAVTQLPSVVIPAHAGHHDLCFMFTQKKLDPMWAINTLTIVPARH
jgi:hexosaminidase